MNRIASTLVLFVLSASLFAQTPALPAITSVPPSIPYVWQNVLISAGGFVSGLVFSPVQPDLVYARTDVGGAYRSDDGGNHWIPLTDQFGPRDSTYTGIESIATDPSDPNKLYIAAGMYTNQWGGPSAIFRSTDKGRTLLKSPMPFKMGGNDDGRGVGERLAVDPNLGSTLYFGSRLNGLWRSTDYGATWSHVDSFPAPAHLTGPGEKTGITFVVFDPSSSSPKGSPTRTIYAGVAQAGISLYRSSDAGLTWQLIPGAPKNLFPTHAAIVPGKTLYFTFDDNPGPNGMTAGAVLRYSIAEAKWDDITPGFPANAPGNHKFGYGGIALDAQHPQTLMVTTQDRWRPKDAIFRSTNGGNKWTEIGPDALYSAPSIPWVYWHKDKIGGTGWMQTIAIDPFHSDKVMYTTGEGIYGSADISAADSGHPTHWGFPDVGLEELVPDMVISPPSGAPLLSAVGDLGGFRHESLTESPKDGMFTNPQFTSGSSIDFAALNPLFIVRVGDDARQHVVHGGYSLDNGISWKPFASEPPGSYQGSGLVAISADGKTVVWSPSRGIPFLTSNWGSSWTQCSGLSSKMRVVADRVDPLKFYSFNPETGQLLESFNAAQSFTANPRPFTSPTNDIQIAPTPGVTGDLWIAAANKLFHSSDSGVTFVTLEGLTAVHRLGFGMAAHGKTIPAIYLTGVVQDTEGLFRSTDAGQTWLRIDDPSHQFGWKNSITGDPRVFGRLYLATSGRGILYGDPALTTNH